MSYEKIAAAVEVAQKELLAIAEVTGKELARLGAEVAWLRSVLKEVEADSRLLTAAVKSSDLSAFGRGVVTTIGARTRKGLAFKCVALCEDVCGPARCQLPIGHPGLHGHVDTLNSTHWGEDENPDPLLVAAYDRGPCGVPCVVLRDGKHERLPCQRPLGHDDEHSHTSRDGRTTTR